MSRLKSFVQANVSIHCPRVSDERPRFVFTKKLNANTANPSASMYNVHKSVSWCVCNLIDLLAENHMNLWIEWRRFLNDFKRNSVLVNTNSRDYQLLITFRRDMYSAISAV